MDVDLLQAIIRKYLRKESALKLLNLTTKIENIAMNSCTSLTSDVSRIRFLEINLDFLNEQIKNWQLI